MKQIKIGDRYCYDDWGAFLAPGWSLSSAEAKTEIVEVPGRDGVIDLSEVLTGEVRYNNRYFRCQLIVPPPRKNWEETRREIEQHCNGKRVKIWTPESDTHHAIGRVSCDFMINRTHAVMTLTADCEPWLYRNNETVLNICVEHIFEGNLYNDFRRVMPTIETSNHIVITVNDVRYGVMAGKKYRGDIILNAGDNAFKIEGHANVKISYQEAIL